MRHSPRHSWWLPVLVALLAADVVLALVFGMLLLGRPDGRVATPVSSGSTTIAGTSVSPSPAVAAGVPARSEAASAPAPATAASTPVPAPTTVTIPTVMPTVSATPPAIAPTVAAIGSADATPSGGSAASPPAAAPTVPAPSAGGRPVAPNPLISRGKPVFASADVAAPAAVVDGRYCAPPAWRTTTFPSWLAIRVGAGPNRLLLSWNSDADNYVDFEDKPVPGIPASYTIQTSADSTNGADGTWQTVAHVRDNAVRTRAHSFPFAGAAWVRMTVTGVPRGTADEPLIIDEIDIHDVSQGSADTVFFMGDSITAAAFLRCDRLRPSFASLVHDAFPDYFPALIDGGVAGVSSDWGVEQVDRWLADNPDYRIWAIAYGTNDAYRERPSPVFEQQLQTLIDKAKAAGKEPVLARIPHTTDETKDEHVQRLNGIIDELTARNGLRRGPDLYTWFRDHPQELARDGVHTTIAGSVSINRLWYEALRERYGLRTGEHPQPVDAGRQGRTGDQAAPDPPLSALLVGEGPARWADGRARARAR